MYTAKWINEQFEAWSPLGMAEEWDNVGLLVGEMSQAVKKILVALDATEDVINEAISGGFDFIICHHPLIYNPIKSVTDSDQVGRKVLALVKNGIGCYCAHTNLDKANGGVNDCLAEKIGLRELSPLIPEGGAKEDFPPVSGTALRDADVCRVMCVGIGRVGVLPKKMRLAEFAAFLENALKIDGVRFCGDSQKIVEKVGLCGGDGSGKRYVDAAVSHGCDVYVTGDLRYHGVQDALECGIALVDITHYGGEIFVLEKIVSRLKLASKNEIEIFASSINGQVFAQN